MTRFIIIVVCSLLSLCAKADYTILFLNTPSIVIGGKTLKVRDSFSPESTIKWTSPRQAMKVLDTRMGEKLVFMSEDFSKARARNSSDYMAYLAKTKPLSTDSGLPSLQGLASYLNNRFYMLDCLDVDTGLTTDSRHYFFITYMHNGREVSKAVRNTGGVFSILPETLGKTGIRSAEEVAVKVYYYDKDADKVSAVGGNMIVVCLPTRL